MPVSSEDISWVRSQLDLPRSKFAALIGVSEATIVRWESGSIDKASGPGPVIILVMREYMEHGGRSEAILAELVSDCIENGAGIGYLFRRLMDAYLECGHVTKSEASMDTVDKILAQDAKSRSQSSKPSKGRTGKHGGKKS